MASQGLEDAPASNASCPRSLQTHNRTIGNYEIGVGQQARQFGCDACRQTTGNQIRKRSAGGESAVAAERAAITRQGLIERAERVYEKAVEAKQLSAATAALKEIGVLTGIRIERSERGAPGGFAWIENASAEELEAFIAGELDIAEISSAKH